MMTRCCALYVIGDECQKRRRYFLASERVACHTETPKANVSLIRTMIWVPLTKQSRPEWAEPEGEWAWPGRKLLATPTEGVIVDCLLEFVGLL